MSPDGAAAPGKEQFRTGRRGVAWIAYRPWEGDLVQGVTLRRPADGKGSPLDLRREASGADGLSPGWRRFLEARAGRMRLVVGMAQVHGNRVQAVDLPPAGGGATLRIVEACDGLVTNAPGVLLTAIVADCVPLFLRDDASGAIGLLHAGWRGTAGEILAAGIDAMRGAFGTAPEDVALYMGPSIAGSCYRVGDEVARRFSRWIDPSPAEGGRIRLDLSAVLARQAEDLGVRSGRILRSDRCTHCRTDLFYSHRAESGRCGRMAAFMGIRDRKSP